MGRKRKNGARKSKLHSPIPEKRHSDDAVAPHFRSNLTNSIRLFLAWSQRWLRTSKPTEWISALGVIATVIGAIVLVRSGFLDQKRSELEEKRSEITVQNLKLELDQRDLIERRDSVRKELESKESILQHREEELAGFQSKIEGKQRELAPYIRNEAALATLREYMLNIDGRGAHDLVCKIDIDPTNDTKTVSLSSRGDALQSPVVSADTEKIVTSIGRLSGVKTLSISGVKLQPTDLATISQIGNINNLALDNCGLDDVGVTNLVVDKNIYYLSLRANNLTKLPQIRHKWSIMALDVTRNLIGDAALPQFLVEASNLYSLTLDNNPVTDITLDAITRGQREIDNIKVVGTRVTPDGLERLIIRCQPRWVIMGRHLESVARFKNTIESNHIKCKVMMLSAPFDEKGEPAIIVGENQRTFQIHDGGVIHANAYELVSVSAGQF